MTLYIPCQYDKKIVLATGIIVTALSLKLHAFHSDPEIPIVLSQSPANALLDFNW